MNIQLWQLGHMVTCMWASLASWNCIYMSYDTINNWLLTIALVNVSIIISWHDLCTLDIYYCSVKVISRERHCKHFSSSFHLLHPKHLSFLPPPSGEQWSVVCISITWCILHCMMGFQNKMTFHKCISICCKHVNDTLNRRTQKDTIFLLIRSP